MRVKIIYKNIIILYITNILFIINHIKDFKNFQEWVIASSLSKIHPYCY